MAPPGGLTPAQWQQLQGLGAQAGTQWQPFTASYPSPPKPKPTLQPPSVVERAAGWTVVGIGAYTWVQLLFLIYARPSLLTQVVAILSRGVTAAVLEGVRRYHVKQRHLQLTVDALAQQA